MAEVVRNGNGIVSRTFLGVLTALATTAIIATAGFTVRTSVSQATMEGKAEVLSVQISNLRETLDVMRQEIAVIEARLRTLEIERQRDLRGGE